MPESMLIGLVISVTKAALSEPPFSGSVVLPPLDEQAPKPRTIIRERMQIKPFFMFSFLSLFYISKGLPKATL